MCVYRLNAFFVLFVCLCFVCVVVWLSYVLVLCSHIGARVVIRGCTSRLCMVCASCLCACGCPIRLSCVCICVCLS